MNVLANYLLWKRIQKRSQAIQQFYSIQPKTTNVEETQSTDEMICRICTSRGDIPITAKVGDIDVLIAIRMVTNIWMSSSDDFPKYICRSCFDELKIALAFKKKCESANWKFRLSLSEVTLANTPPMVFHDFTLILHQMRERRLRAADQTRTAESRLSQESERFQTTDNNKSVTEKSIREESVRDYKCKRCDITFDSKELLLQHRRGRNCLHMPCSICSKVVSSLAHHKKAVHLRAEKCTCHICGKVAYSSAGLDNHLLVHTDKFRYPCPLCPYKGKRKSYLALHMRVHTGEQRYLCSECPARFVNVSNLRRHQRTHSSKKFQCSKCKKQFRLEKTLKEHYEAAHLNMRYRCSICGRELWTRRKLLAHELRVHKREKRKLYEELHKVVVNEEV